MMPVELPGTAWPTNSGRHPDAPLGQATDFGYWQQLFDQARGTGLPGAELAAPGHPASSADPGASPGGTGSGPATLAADAEPSAPASSQASGRGPGPEGRMSSAALEARGQPAPSWLASSTAAGVKGARSLNTTAAAGASSAEWLESRRRQGHLTASSASALPSALQARLHRTANGDWHVSMRADPSLSTTQVLGVVAQALADAGPGQGQVEQVTLNGRCIYQQGAPAPGGAGAAPRFELDC